MLDVTTCDVCGAELRVGMWPFCKGDPASHTTGSIRGYFNPFRPYVDEHILPGGKDVGPSHNGQERVRGTWITSREQRRHIMKANNLEWGNRKRGLPHSEY